MVFQNPEFTIIIPTYNRPECLQQCLQSLTQLNYPTGQFEVIVVDDGGPTPLDKVIATVEHSLNVRLLRQSNSGPAKARNAGAKEAKGKYLAFTDDDCTPAPDWLDRLHQHFATNAHVLIGGQILNALPDNPFSSASQILIDYLYSYYNQKSETANFFTSNNIAISKELFHKIGGFDHSYPMAAAEDRELCDRWLQQGHTLLYADDVQVQHAHHLSLKSFWRQHFNYGRGAFHFHLVRAQRKAEAIKLEPLSFYFRLLTYPFKKYLGWWAVSLSGLLFLSQIANTAGFFLERNKHKHYPGYNHYAH